MASPLEPYRRPLAETEVRMLRAKARGLKSRGRRASVAYLPVGIGIILSLWLITVLVSDAPMLVITFFWIGIGCLILLWVGEDARKAAKQMEAMARDLDSAIKRNLAEVYDVRAKSFVEFEEIEDEGACYAFELEGDRILFVAGQEFYRGAKFPSLDFSLVHPLDETGMPVDAWIEKRAAAAEPERVIAAPQKNRLNLPEHLHVLSGDIDQLEKLLSDAL